MRDVVRDGIVWVFSKPGDGPKGTYRWYQQVPCELDAELFAEEHKLTREGMSIHEYIKRTGEES